MGGSEQVATAGEAAPKQSRALGVYQPGLDGLRAVAMSVMLAYHGELAWAKGAFLGLSQFFTLSGFLITTMLLRTQQREGAIHLPTFWGRRYLRLLPAAFITLAGIVVFGMFVASPQQVTELPGQVAAAAAQVANWYFIWTDKSYIDLFVAPSPVQHFWSLAVEEQFYILMPIGLFLLFRRTRSLKVIGGIFVGGALASTAWMIFLYNSGASLDRLYYGTDTRAAELLVGAALAVALHRFPLRPGPRGKQVLAVVGVVAFAITAWGSTQIGLVDGPIWRGGFLAFSLVSAALIVSVLGNHGPVAAVLAWGFLPAMGRITYGLYLYHWPLFLWLDEERTGLDGWALFAVRMVLTFAIAIASYNLLEMPIRNGALSRLPARAQWALAPAVALIIVLGAVVVSNREIEDQYVALSEPAAGVPVIVDDDVTDVLIISDEAGTAVTERMQGLADDATAVVVAEPFACEPVEEVDNQPRCANWQSHWTELIDQHDPDVVLFNVTRWAPSDIADASGLRMQDTDALNGWTQDVLRNGFDILSARGAPIVWAPANADFTGQMQRQSEPFDRAMIQLSNERDDIRRVVTTEAPPESSDAAYVDQRATGLLNDVELYRRRSASDLPRVLVVGDSAARTMGYGFERWATETGAAVVWTSATEGCGIAIDGTVREMAIRPGPVTDRCREVPGAWPGQIEMFDPDIVIVLSTLWDVQTRKLESWPDYLGPGDAQFDEYLLDQYLAAADVLSASGATVVWFEIPCAREFRLAGQAGDPNPVYDVERAVHVNEAILPALASARPDDVVVFDMFDALCPDGTFVEDLPGGGNVRPDGIHLSADGSRWFADTYGADLLEQVRNP